MQTGNGFRPVRLPKDKQFFVAASVRVRKCVPFFEMERRHGALADGNMKQHSISLEHIGASNDLESAVLDVQGFAVLAHIPKATILTLRSRSPDKLPPPFRQRPLRWRTETVVRWMEKQEQSEIERISRIHRRG